MSVRQSKFVYNNRVVVLDLIQAMCSPSRMYRAHAARFLHQVHAGLVHRGTTLSDTLATTFDCSFVATPGA